MKLQCIITMLFFYSCGYTQSYIPTVVEGNHWEIMRNVGLGNYLTWNYELECDTIINLQTYAIIQESNTDTIIGFVREDVDAKEVFYLDKNSTEESLIISYALAQGDTFSLESEIFVVDTVYFEDWFGASRKVIQFSDVVKFIEGLGHLWTGVMDDSFAGFGYPFQFISDHYNTGEDCGITSYDDIASDPINIYPNPFSDFIEIIADQKPVGLISFYAISGILIESVNASGNFTIKTAHLPPGIYLIRENGRIHKLAKN